MSDLVAIKEGNIAEIDSEEYAVFGSKPAFEKVGNDKVQVGGKYEVIVQPSIDAITLDTFDEVTVQNEGGKTSTDAGVFIVENDGFFQIQYSLTLLQENPVEDMSIHVESAKFGRLITSPILPTRSHAFAITIPEVYLEAGDELRLVVTRENTKSVLSFTIENAFFLYKRLNLKESIEEPVADSII